MLEVFRVMDYDEYVVSCYPANAFLSSFTFSLSLSLFPFFLFFFTTSLFFPLISSPSLFFRTRSSTLVPRCSFKRVDRQTREDLTYFPSVFSPPRQPRLPRLSDHVEEGNAKERKKERERERCKKLIQTKGH